MIKAKLFDIAVFEQHLREKIMLADSSIYVYVQCIKKFLEKDPYVDDLDAYNQFIIKYAIKKRNTHYYSILKRFIEWKITDRKIRDRLIEDLISPPQRTDIKRERKHLDEDRILDVINSLAKEKHRIVAIIQNLTGIRAADVLRLKDGDISPEEYKKKPVLRLNVLGKGNKRVVVFLHDEVAQVLVWNYIMENEGHNNYHFINIGQMKGREGNLDNEYSMVKLNYWWYWYDLKQALIHNGIDREDFATHDLRRCFARRVWEKYKDIHVLQGLLHHKNADTTLRYLAQSGLKNIDYLQEMQS